MNLKKICLLGVLPLVSVLIAHAQEETAGFQWARNISGTDTDIAYSVTTDISGNIITTGQFGGTVDFNPGTAIFNLTSAGSSDIFVSKLDAAGNFLWAVRIGSTTADIGRSVKTDAAGNVYVAGEFTGTVDFNPAAGTFPLTSQGNQDAFLLKLDVNGNFLWAARIGSTGTDRISAVTIDISGNVYATGVFAGTADFNPGTGVSNLTAAGSSDGFVVRLNSSGAFSGAVHFGGTASAVTATSIALDPDGNILTAGSFTGTVDFNPGAPIVNLAAAGTLSDIFISKLTNTGAFVWAKSMGGTAADVGQGVITDNAGNVFTTGYFQDVVDFDPGPGTANETSAGSTDIFLSKFDMNGNFVWTKRFGSAGIDYAFALACDSENNIYGTSTFTQTTDFDPGADYFTMTPSGIGDLAVFKLNSAGNLVWATRMGGNNAAILPSITLDANNNIIAAAYFGGTIDVNPEPPIVNFISTGTDCFIVKLNSETVHTTNFTFDIDAEGWTTRDAQGSPAPLTFSTGGNPGGMIGADDQPTPFSYFVAPATILGNQCGSYGKYLTYDLQQNVGRAYVDFPNVIISDGNTTFEYSPTVQVYPAVAPGWTTYTVPLIEGSEWTNEADGSAATELQMKTILCNLTRLEIRGRMGSSSAGSARLDNVSIQTVPPSAPPVITSFTPSAAIPGSTVTITGTNFATTPAANVVCFNGVNAVVTSASATQLEVTVPIGAKLGGITVLNNTSMLLAQSATQFEPLFADGGAIIPASLKLRQDVYLSANQTVNGLSLADFDGDGWIDVLLAESGTGGISFYRNLGAGGQLVPASFSPKKSLFDFSVLGNHGKVRVADIDGDGKKDIAVPLHAESFTYTVFFRNTSFPGTISFEADEIIVTASSDLEDFQFADIDGDGKTDLLQSLSEECSASAFGIYRGMSEPGNIEFLGYQNFDAEAFCLAGEMTIADFNSDQKPDVLVVNASNTQIHILENISVPGTVSFRTPVLVPATVAVLGSVRAVDLNNDNTPDLAWRNSGTNDVRIRINANTGGILNGANFTTEVILTSDLTGTYGGLSVADFNGDGRMDLIATDDFDFGIFENLSTTTTISATDFSFYEYQGPFTESRPSAPEIADLNGDHRPDVISGSTFGTPAKLMVFENINAHTPAISITTVSPLQGPVGTNVTITGDYFSTNANENTVLFGSIKAQVLSATRTQITAVVPAGAGYGPVSVTTHELTAEYHLPFDVVFASSATIDETSFGTNVDFAVTNALGDDLDVGDLNSDNKPEVIFEGSASTTAPIYTYAFRNTHTGTTITTSSLLPDDTTFFSMASPKLVDLNGDAKPDIISEDGIARNESFGMEVNFNGRVLVGGTVVNSSTGDFNLDGRTDITGINTSYIQIHENRTRLGPFVPVGNFSSASSAFYIFKNHSGGGHTVADFDGDGLKDLVASNPAADNIVIWKNTGAYRVTNTMFDSVTFSPTLNNPIKIYKADFDVDGKIDLAVIYGPDTESDQKKISVFRNQSTATTISFTRHDYDLPTSSPSAEIVTNLGIGDLDGDGRPEMVIVSQAANSFRIWKNNSSPGALTATSFTVSDQIALTTPRNVVVGDINQDGKGDLIFLRAGFVTIKQNLMPNAAISFTVQPAPTTVCEAGTVNIGLTATGDTNLQYQWQTFDGTQFTDLSDDVNYSGVNSNILTITDATLSMSGAEYRCLVRGDYATYTNSDTVTLTVNALPAAPGTTGGTACSGLTVSLSASGASDGNYRWYTQSTGGSALAGQVNDTYTTPVLAATTSYFVSIHNGTCESLRTEVVATINPLPPVPETTNAFRCSAGSLTLEASGSAEGNYRWYTVASGGTALTGEVNSQYVTPSISATTDYFVSVNNGTCESGRTTVTATIHTPPSAPVITSNFPLTNNTINFCNQPLVFSAPPGFTAYQWSDGTQTEELSITEAGTYSVQVTDANGCTSESSNEITVVFDASICNSPPVIAEGTATAPIDGKLTIDLLPLLSDPDDNLDLTTLDIVTPPSSGATAVIDGTNLIITYTGTFAGIETLTIIVCDEFESCTEEQIQIEIVGDIEVFNAVSPNGDDLNSFLRLEYIEVLQDTRDNHVSIFNRWGDVVFEIDDYNNTTRVFTGLSSNGKELPTGTYFYRIDFRSGRSSKTGYLTLKR